MGKIIFRIGDSSGDGHSQVEVIVLNCNKTAQEIEEAYPLSCKLTGLVFTENTSVIVEEKEIDWKHYEYNDRRICVDYENSEISDLAIEILKNFEIELKENDVSPSGLLDLFMKFIKLSIPDLEWEFVEMEGSTVNLSLGYGLFY